MKKIIIFLAFALAFLGANECQAMWKIEKNGTPTSYLIGTMHINYKTHELAPCMQEAINSSKALMTEIFMPISQDEMINDDMIELMAMMMNPSNPNNLKSQIGEDLYAKIEKILSKTKPEVVMMMPFLQDWAIELLNINLSTNEDLSETKGGDFMLSAFAKEKGITRLGLEKSTKSAEIFKQIPKDILHRDMKIGIEHIDENSAMATQMVDWYNSGEIDKILAFTFDKNKALKYVPTMDRAFWEDLLYTKLLDDRTASWIEPILHQINKEPTTIAVGLGHIAKEKGLIKALQNAGFSVTQMK